MSASIVVSTVSVDSASLTPNPVAAASQLKLAIGASANSETYLYDVAPVCGRVRSILTTEFSRQSWPTLSKQA